MQRTDALLCSINARLGCLMVGKPCGGEEFEPLGDAWLADLSVLARHEDRPDEDEDRPGWEEQVKRLGVGSDDEELPMEGPVWAQGGVWDDGD